MDLANIQALIHEAQADANLNGVPVFLVRDKNNSLSLQRTPTVHNIEVFHPLPKDSQQ